MRRWMCLGMAALLVTSVAAVAPGRGQATGGSGDATTSITLRVLQRHDDPAAIYVSNRSGRHWVGHVAIRVATDDGVDHGRYQYGDITVELPVTAETDRVTTKVDVRIWQDMWNPLSLYVAARAQGDSWTRNGTRKLPLAGTTYFGEYRYGDIPVEVPWDPSASPPAPVTSLATPVWVGDVAADRQEKILAHLDHVMAFYQDRFGLEPQPFSLLVAPDFATAVSKLQSLGGKWQALGAYTGWSDDHGFFVLFNDSNYARADAQDSVIGPSVRGVLAKEYFRVLQRILSGDKTPQVPDWLEEGTALYVTDLYHPAGLGEDLTFYAWTGGTIPHYLVMGRTPTQRMDSASYVQLPLKTLEDNALLHGLRTAGHHPGHNLGALAVRWLVQRAGEESVIAFWRELEQSETWQDAFLATFGMTTESFYAAFEKHREDVFPTPSRIQGTVVGPDGEPLEGIWVEIWERGVTLGTGTPRPGFASAQTGEDGGFEVRRLDASYGLVLYVSLGGGKQKQLGWYNGDGVGPCSEAALVVVSGADITGITIRLPGEPADLPDIRPEDRRFTSCAG